MKKILNIKVR